MSPLVAGLMRGPPPGSFQEGYAPGYYTALGYTELWAENWSGYADTAAVLAAYSWGSSSQSNVPRIAYITKKTSNAVFPHSLEGLYPYSEDCSSCAGSAGRQWVLTKSFGATHNRVWRRWVEAYGGTEHPDHPSPSDFQHSGSFPGGANSVKEVFWQLPSPGNKRVGWHWFNANGRAYDTDWDSNPAMTEAVISATGVTALLTGTNPPRHDESASYTGKEWIEWTENYYKFTDDIWIIRSWRQQLTLNSLWNPQARKMSGIVCTRTSGDAFQGVSGWTWRLNKNKTTPDDGLSTTDWDVPDVNITPFRESNNDADDGLVARAENTKPWRGMRRYFGPMFAITGGDNAPFDDHLGNNLDDDGRDHASWPVGA